MKANDPYIQDIYIYYTINRQFLQVGNGGLICSFWWTILTFQNPSVFFIGR